VGVTDITAETTSKSAYGDSATYTTARTTGTGTVPNLEVGEEKVIGFYVPRGFLGFDLSTITGVITAATLYMKYKADDSVTDFNVRVVKGLQTAGTVTSATFNSFTGYNSSGAHTPTYYGSGRSTSRYSADTWETFPFTATGITNINTFTGESWFPICLLGSNDIAETEPANKQSVTFYPPTAASSEPYLRLTHSDTYYQATGGSLTPAGDLVNQIEIFRTLGGSITMTGIGIGGIRYFASIAGSLTAYGSTTSATVLPESIGGSITPFGTLNTGNPNWIQIPDSLNWQGVWDADTAYSIDDAILYLFGDRYHVFISKTHHNTGNNPVTSTANWRRWDAQPWQPSEGV